MNNGLKTVDALTRLPEETERPEMRGRDGSIFNLGHGVPPTARLENIELVVETVRPFV